MPRVRGGVHLLRAYCALIARLLRAYIYWRAGGVMSRRKGLWSESHFDQLHDEGLLTARRLGWMQEEPELPPAKCTDCDDHKWCHRCDGHGCEVCHESGRCWSCAGDEWKANWLHEQKVMADATRRES